VTPTVYILLMLIAFLVLILQLYNDYQWRGLLKRLPLVRQNMRQKMLEELCLDCRVGEPHMCQFYNWAYMDIL
jgi:hypothetical protein